MGDSEALSEKKLQEIAKEEEATKRKDQFKGHFERFRKNPKDDVKPEVKKIPKGPEEKQAEKESRRRLRSPPAKRKSC